MAGLKVFGKKLFRILLRIKCFLFAVIKIILHRLKLILVWFVTKAHDFAVDAGRETGILAITLMANRNLHSFERGLWLFVVGAAIFGAIKLSNQQIRRYMNSPTVVSVDRDYRGWNGSLPAVTLCYYDHIDSFKANEYIQDNWNVSIVDEDYFYFMDFLYSVVNASASNYADLARFADDERFDDVDLFDLIRAIDRPFEQVITSFDADFDVQVLPVMTERGSCYAINSPFSEILTGSRIEYKDLKPPLVCQYGKQQCYIKMDLYESTGTIDIHSPFEVSATDANVFALHKSDEITAFYKLNTNIYRTNKEFFKINRASKNLRDLTVEQRKCVFHDEETSSLKIYSKSLCLVRCRAVMALEMCNCVPFFYPFVDGPSCNPAGFECLLDFKWPVWALHICKCPSTCTEIEYSIQTVKKSSWGVKTNEEGAKSDVVTSSFRWDLMPPKVRMRRDVVFSFEDLLVSFGGAAALLLGFSLLSITQLLYTLVFHIIVNTAEVFMSCLMFLKCIFNPCKRLLKRNSKPKRTLEEVKPVNSDPSSSLKLRRKLLARVHCKNSDDLSDIESVLKFKQNKQHKNDNTSYELNVTYVQPEFEYIE